jgi:hypothetical protein
MEERAMQSMQSETRGTESLVYWAGILSLGAGAIHGVATLEHWREWWGYGVFFMLAATAQVLYGLLLLMGPWRYDSTGASRAAAASHGYARPLYLAGVAGNASIIVLYLITRTIGVPLFGPQAGEVEPITTLSLLSKLTESALIMVLVVLLRRTSPAVNRRRA